MRPPADRLPVRGADLVLMAMQRLWPHDRLSHNTLMVVETDGPIAPVRVGRALERFVEFCAVPASRLRRPFPWGKLYWTLAPRGAAMAPPVDYRSVTEMSRLLERELNDAIDPRRDPPLRVLIADVAGDPPRTLLVMTWYHPLMDPRGGHNLLAHLADIDRHAGAVPWNGAPPSFVSVPERRPFRERARLAARSVDYMRSLMSVAPVSLGSGLSTTGPVRFRQEAFVDPGGGAGASGARRDFWWRLALVGKAMAELWQARRLPDIPFLVPISVDLRRKGSAEPTFGNALAFHFARFRPSDTADLFALERHLRRQMIAAMRDGQIEGNGVAMEFLHYRPFWMMLRDLPGTARGETFSFNCADVGGVPAALASAFGRRIVNVYHAPAVLPRPGIGVFFTRCGDLHNVVVSWVDGVVGDAEVARITEVVREGMGWDRPR